MKCSNCGHSSEYHTGSDSWGIDEDIWTNTICIHKKCDPSGFGSRDSSKCNFLEDSEGYIIRDQTEITQNKKKKKENEEK